MQVPRLDETIFVLDRDAVFRLWLIHATESGQLDAGPAERLWTRHSADPGFLAAYFSAPDETGLLATLYDDLDEALGRAWLKTYHGALHVVAKGGLRMRRLLVTPRFGGQPVKVVALALGRASPLSVGQGSAITSLILLTRADVAQAVLNDEVMLTQTGLPAGAILRAAGAGNIGAAAGTLAAGAIVGTFAIDTLVVAAAVTAGTNAALAWLDSRSTQVARLRRQLSDGSARLQAEAGELTRWGEGRGTLAPRAPGRLVDLGPGPGARQLGRLSWQFVAHI